MEFPENTKEDIEDSTPISLVGKVVRTRSFDNGDELYNIKDAEQNNIELKVWPEETELYEIETDEWYLFECAEGDVFDGDQKLGSNRGNMEAIKLDGPPEFVEFTEEQSSASGETVNGGIVAVDIETISTVSERELDLENSDHIELLCIGVGYTPKLGNPGHSEVLFRQGSSVEAEANLLERFRDYVESRDPDQLLMFKGDFDRTHLRGRARRVNSSDLEERVSEILDEHEIINLDPPGSLEENIEDPVETHWDIYHHTLTPADWRAENPRYSGDLDDPKVTNKDISDFGKRYLELYDEGQDTREYRALRELIRHYTESDIDPLFRLAG